MAVFSCDEAGEHVKASGVDDVVVITPPELHATVFDDAQPAPLAAIFGIQLFEPDHAMSDALHLQVVIGRGHVVEQHDCALAVGKYCFSARIWRRYRSALPERSRSSDKES